VKVGDLTKNISRTELKCQCGNCNYQFADFETIMAIQFACNHFAELLNRPKVTLIITSAARCPEHNKTVGGARNSYHQTGAAIDHVIKDVSNYELAEFYRRNYPNKFGVGEYRNFVHLDSRPDAARWEG